MKALIIITAIAGVTLLGAAAVEASSFHISYGHHGHHDGDHGYDYRKVWVPGHHVTHYDACGNPYDVWEGGYYKRVPRYHENHHGHRGYPARKVCYRW